MESRVRSGTEEDGGTQTRPSAWRELPRSPTGIEGLDEITGGGLPRGRPTLLCGAAGCGKTLLAMEFLVSGAARFGEPGVFVAFEETADELVQNVRSLGFEADRLVRRKKLVIDHVRVERSEIQETGEYDLEGLFVRLGHAIDSVGARRVVLDTIESLFSGFSDTAVLRAELRRLLRWLKDRGVTAIVTGERGDGLLTRQGARGDSERRREGARATTGGRPGRGGRRRPGTAGGAPPARPARKRAEPVRGTELMPTMSKARPVNNGRPGPRPGRRGAETWQLHLYVAGRSPKSVAAYANLVRICEEDLGGRYTIDVVDLLKNPHFARGDQIVAIPTLVRKLPEPMRQIVGDLSNTDQTLVGLQLRPLPRG